MISKAALVIVLGVCTRTFAYEAFLAGANLCCCPVSEGKYSWAWNGKGAQPSGYDKCNSQCKEGGDDCGKKPEKVCPGNAQYVELSPLAEDKLPTCVDACLYLEGEEKTKCENFCNFPVPAFQSCDAGCQWAGMPGNTKEGKIKCAEGFCSCTAAPSHYSDVITKATKRSVCKGVCACSADSNVKECRALVDLFTGTKGTSWKAKRAWLSTKHVCSWENVKCNSANRVTELNMPNNDLEGSLATSISGLDEVVVLSLHNNKLSKTIPNAITTLAKMRKLDLHKNQLTGKLPTDIGKLQALEKLYVYDNLLDNSKGALPASASALNAMFFSNGCNLESGGTDGAPRSFAWSGRYKGTNPGQNIKPGGKACELYSKDALDPVRRADGCYFQESIVPDACLSTKSDKSE